MARTGVITATSNDSGIVSVIEDVRLAFSFRKEILYAFGVQCRGRVDNILEVGMQVNVSFTSQPNKPRITAVWLGDKPELPQETDASLYGCQGRLHSWNDGSFRIECDRFQQPLLVEKRRIYCDGRFLDGDDTAVGETITFDVAPLRRYVTATVEYVVTFAWVGPLEPRLVDRFGLRDTQENSHECCDDDIVSGVVTVIPNDVMALVEVVSHGKVVLFRSSFKSGFLPWQSLQDVVCVGETLSLRVRRGYLLPGCNQWFATEAWKYCVEISHDKANVVQSSVKTQQDETSVQATTDKGSEVVDIQRFDKFSKVLFDIPPLSGVVSHLSSKCCCISYRDIKIIVHKKNVYIERSVCTRNELYELCSSGKKSVNFEAVLSSKYKDWNGITHEAMCAWVGERPSMTDMVGALPEPQITLLDTDDRIFTGTVFKFDLPKVALINVDGGKMIAYASSHAFGCKKMSRRHCVQTGNCITNFLNLNDIVQFKVKGYDTISRLAIPFDIEILSGDPEKRIAPMSTLLDGAEPTGRISPVTSGLNKVSFEKSKRFVKQPRLLDCVGTLKKAENCGKDRFKIQHESVDSVAIHSPVIFGLNGDKPITFETFEVHGTNKIVRFDADIIKSETSFHVRRIWAQNERPPPSECLKSELSNFGSTAILLPSQLYSGTIRSIPLFDSAIAVVNHVPVLVPIKSLVVSEQINSSYCSIDEYLSVGDYVVLRVKEEAFEECDKLYSAEKCWASQNASNDSRRRVRLYALNERGPVVRKGDNYHVHFTRPGLRFNLDLFAKGRIFVEGKPVGREEAHILEGRTINYHVAFCTDMQNGDHPKDFFVACAWIGNEVRPTDLLQDLVLVPKGLICTNWYFECVVHDFPFPAHVLCRIGPIPVVVPLDVISSEGLTVLTTGDRISLPVQEVAVESHAWLTSNKAADIPRPFNSVYKKFLGIITAEPNPVGLINIPTVNIKVCFELCHVQTGRSRLEDKEKLSALYTRITSRTVVGEEVYCTAVKRSGKVAPYRAVEVWVKHGWASFYLAR